MDEKDNIHSTVIYLYLNPFIRNILSNHKSVGILSLLMITFRNTHAHTYHANSFLDTFFDFYT